MGMNRILDLFAKKSSSDPKCKENENRAFSDDFLAYCSRKEKNAPRCGAHLYICQSVENDFIELFHQKPMRSLLFLILFLPLGLIAQRNDDETRGGRDNGRVREEDPSPDEKLPFSKRLVFGGNFGLGFSNGWYVNLSPTVGYRVTDNFITGIGGTYIFTQINVAGSNTSYFQHVYGGNLFARYAPFAKTGIQMLSNLYAHSEYQHLFVVSGARNANGSIRESRSAPGLLLGGGYTTGFGRGPAFNVDVLYNVLWRSDNSPYPSPLIVRAGFSFGM
jgi:hypothetical protein